MRRFGGTRLLLLLVGLMVAPALALAQTPRPVPSKAPSAPTAAAPATESSRSNSSASNSSGLGLELGKRESGKPVEIEADQGIEWQQSNQVYIARGNAKAKRGSVTVYADTLTAHYRPSAKPPSSAPAAPGKGDDIASGTDIDKVDADGHVRIATETQTVSGDHATYDVDKGTLVVTGSNLKLVTQRDTVTARDSLEWYDRDQLAVARGDAVAVRDQKRVRGDTLTAKVEKDTKGAQHIARVDAQGNVAVSTADQVGRSDSGVYNVDTGIATLVGHVRLIRADNELRGQYAVFDLNNNVSRLLSAPPSASLTGGPPPRVEGLIMPRAKPNAVEPQSSVAPN